MTIIESKKVTVDANAQSVFAFLSDMNNISKLLPQDKILDWKSDEKSCSFKIQKAYTIGLNFVAGVAYSNIEYCSADGSPFSFSLNTTLLDLDGKTEAQLICNADINPFLKMLVVGPLQNLFDYMADRLGRQFAQPSI